MDPISDMLIRVKNASRVKHESVSVPLSRSKVAIAELLVREGYLRGISKRGKKVKKTLSLDLVYNADGTPRVQDVERVSKPSRRVYISAKDIRPVRQGLGLLVLSTPMGVITGAEAKEKKVGGEVLFKIW